MPIRSLDNHDNWLSKKIKSFLSLFHATYAKMSGVQSARKLQNGHAFQDCTFGPLRSSKRGM